MFVAKISIADQPGSSSSWENFRNIYNRELTFLAYHTRSQLWFDEEAAHHEYLEGWTNVRQNIYAAYIYRQMESTNAIYSMAKFLQGYVETENLLYRSGLKLEFLDELPMLAPPCYNPETEQWEMPKPLK